MIEFSNVTAKPIGKVQAFLQNGPEDSVAYASRGLTASRSVRGALIA